MVKGRSLAKHIGSGTVWLAFDATTDDYLCSWRDDSSGHVLEEGRAASEAAAVDWGRARTQQVVFQNGGDRFWAGTGSAPSGMAGYWSDDAT